MLKIHDEYRMKDGQPKDAYSDVRYVQGHAAALMWQRAVEHALDEGHRSPSGDNLKDALETFHEVTLDGMTAGAISFTAQDHRPQMQEVVYKLNSDVKLEFVESSSIGRRDDWLGY